MAFGGIATPILLDSHSCTDFCAVAAVFAARKALDIGPVDWGDLLLVVPKVPSSSFKLADPSYPFIDARWGGAVSSRVVLAACAHENNPR